MILLTDKLPYHVFRYRNKNLLYSPVSRSVLQLDDVAFELLSCHEQNSDPLLAKEHSADIADRVRRELRFLQGKHLIDRLEENSAAEARQVARLVGRYARWPSKGAELFMGEACNLRCVYCYASHNRALQGSLMSREVALQGIAFALQRNEALRRLRLTFFGGEPLLNFPVMQFVIGAARQQARRLGKRVSFALVTNATLLDDDMVGFLRRARVQTTVSFDGPPELQDATRPYASGHGSYAATFRGACKLREAGVPMTIRSTVTPRCLAKTKLVDFFHEQGFRGVHLTCSEGRTEARSAFDVGPEHWGALHQEDDVLADRVLDTARAGTELSYNPFQDGLQRLAKGPLQALPCGVTRAVTTVGVDGRLYPCHRYVGMDAFTIGDVWHGVDKSRQMEYLHGYFQVRMKCRSCWARALCNLGCPWYYSRLDGGFKAVDQWRCEEAMRTAERTIWLYARLVEDAPNYLANITGRKTSDAVM